MNDLFYRKEKEKPGIRTTLRKLFKNRKLVLGLAAGTLVLSYVLFANHGIVQRFKLQNRKAELKAKIHEAEQETRQLQATSKALEGDRRAIEKVARERYGMHREGETVYKVKKEK